MTPAIRQWLEDQAQNARVDAWWGVAGLVNHAINPAADMRTERLANELANEANDLANYLDDLLNPPRLCAMCDCPAIHVDMYGAPEGGLCCCGRGDCCDVGMFATRESLP